MYKKTHDASVVTHFFFFISRACETDKREKKKYASKMEEVFLARMEAKTEGNEKKKKNS